jgi:hypothetical protein
MKKILLVFCFLVGLSVRAVADGSLEFGSSYHDAIVSIKAQLGSPVTESSDTLIYKNIDYCGFRWDQVVFRFRNGILTETRCYMYQANKDRAVGRLSAIAKEMEKTHVMTMDYEDDGTVFYAGGRSPEGYGHLFTIYASPYRGRWSAQLRFGPFAL